jgi:O-antigen/teichoic acid export membrane protein
MESSTARSLFARGIFVAGVSVVLMGIINYLFRRLLIVNLSTDDYGYFYSCLAIALTLLAVFDLGMGESQAILISKYSEKGDFTRTRRLMNSVMFAKLAAGVLLLGIMLAALPALTEFTGKSEYGVLVLSMLLCTLPFVMVYSTHLSALQGKKDFVARSGLQLIKFAMILIATWWFIKDYGIRAPVFSYFSGSVLVTVITVVYILARHRNLMLPLEVSGDPLKEVALYSVWVAISVAGQMFVTQIDTLMLTYFTDLHQVALYNVALPVLQIFHAFLIFPLVFAPIATNLWQHGAREDIASLFRATFDLLLACSWMFVLVVFVYAEPIVAMMFDEKVVAAAKPLMLLTCGTAFLIMSRVTITLLNAMQRQKDIALVVAAGVILNIVANVFLIPHFGMMGAAAASVATYMFIYLGSIRLLRKEIPLNSIAVSFLKFSVPAAALAFILWRYGTEVETGSVRHGLVGLLLGAYTVLVAVLLWKWIPYFRAVVTSQVAGDK